MFGKNKIFSGKGRGMTYDLMAFCLNWQAYCKKKNCAKNGVTITYCPVVEKNYNFPFISWPHKIANRFFSHKLKEKKKKLKKFS